MRTNYLYAKVNNNVALMGVFMLKKEKIFGIMALLTVFSALLSSDGITVGTEGVEATGWWNVDWKYRMPIKMEEKSGDTLTDYQVSVNVDTALLIATGKMQTNSADIRFTDFAGNEIPYWIESGINTENTTIWVKVPQIPALGTETIYMYYGNPTASNAANASAVFDFFDDFVGTELDVAKWTWRAVATSGGIPVQPGIGYVTVANSTVSVVSPNTDGWEQATELTTISNFTLPLVLEGNLSVPNWGGYGSAGWYRAAWGGLSDSNMSQGSSSMRHGVVFFLASENEYCPYVLDEGVSGYLSNYPDTPIDFHTYRAIWKTNSTEFYRDGIYHEEVTTNVPKVSLPIWFLTSQWGGPGWPESRIDVDWVRVRKYAFPEPTCLLGSEEAFTDFSVHWEEETYHVTTISNSTISDFEFNGTAICFNVTGIDGTTGFCRICIPTALMNDTYRVYVNSTEVPCTLLPESNTTHSHLYFTYNHSTQEVVIIPEFPSSLVLPLLMSFSLVAVVLSKKKRHQSKHR